MPSVATAARQRQTPVDTAMPWREACDRDAIDDQTHREAIQVIGRADARREADGRETGEGQQAA